MIGRGVAPNGGRKAANLRLASRHLDTVITPIVLSSIFLPSDPFNLDSLMSVLADLAAPQRALITSVRYDVHDINFQRVLPLVVLKSLPNLKRLHLLGVTDYIPSVRPETFSVLAQNVAVSLRLENIDLASHSDVGKLAPKAEHLEVVRCTGERTILYHLVGRVFHFIDMPPSLRSFSYVPRTDDSSAEQIIRVLLATFGTGTMEELNLLWEPISQASNENILIDTDKKRHPAARNFSVTLTGLEDLFSITSNNRAACASNFARVWTAFSRGVKMTALSLPVHGSLFYEDSLDHLVLPDLVDVAFVNYSNGPDLLQLRKFLNYGGLVKFLTRPAFPNLRTLRLRGWMDGTGAVALSKTSIDDFPIVHPHLYSLLGVLEKRGIKELRLRNGEGHDEADAELGISQGPRIAIIVRFWSSIIGGGIIGIIGNKDTLFGYFAIFGSI
ncbi:hypothetical protein RQP46_008952 [Phenoliferia psychrophenolica]